MSTQLREVLRVLYKNKEKWLGEYEIKVQCKLPGISVSRYIIICLRNDWVYAPNSQGKVTISPDGEEAYINSNN